MHVFLDQGPSANSKVRAFAACAQAPVQFDTLDTWLQVCREAFFRRLRAPFRIIIFCPALYVV